MNKAERISLFVNEKPHIMPKIFNTAKGTSIWRGEGDFLLMDVSMSYAYSIAKREHNKFMRTKRETVTEEAPNTLSEVKSWWRTFTRTIRVNIRLAIRKVRSWIS